MPFPSDPLLRCFAKIEILLDKEGLSLTNPELRGNKLEERMIRRWADPSPPRPREGTTMLIARAIWQQMHEAKAAPVQSSVLRELHSLAGNSTLTWKSADELGLWLVECSHDAGAKIQPAPSLPAPVPAGTAPGLENPFYARRALDQDPMFYGRANELRRIRTYLTGTQSLQIVGPRRIGKTSLLHQVRHSAAGWLGVQTRTAFIDMQGITSKTAWFKLASDRFGFSTMPTTVEGFSQAVQDACEKGIRLVLCLDEFEGFAEYPGEFTENFYDMLRSLAQDVMYPGRFSIVSSSRVPVSELCARSPEMSALYNIMSLVPVAPFRPEEAEGFVQAPRPGFPAFTAVEAEAILRRARAHPLKLMVACYHVREARITGDDLETALKNCSAEIVALMGEGE